MKRLMVIVALVMLLFGTGVFAQEVTPDAGVTVVNTEVMPPDAAGTPAIAAIVTQGGAQQYVLVVGVIALLVVLMISQQVLNYWLARNNVKLVDPTLLNSMYSNIAGSLVQFAYQGTKLTTSPVDDEVLLMLARRSFDIQQNPDGSISLKPRESAAQ